MPVFSDMAVGERLADYTATASRPPRLAATHLSANVRADGRLILLSSRPKLVSVFVDTPEQEVGATLDTQRESTHSWVCPCRSLRGQSTYRPHGWATPASNLTLLMALLADLRYASRGFVRAVAVDPSEAPQTK